MKPVIDTLDDDDRAAADAIPDDFDAEAYYAGVEPELREIFSSPIVTEGLMGDSLL